MRFRLIARLCTDPSRKLLLVATLETVSRAASLDRGRSALPKRGVRARSNNAPTAGRTGRAYSARHFYGERIGSFSGASPVRIHHWVSHCSGSFYHRAVELLNGAGGAMAVEEASGLY